MSTINDLMRNEPNLQPAVISSFANLNADGGDGTPDVPDNTPPGGDPGPDR